MSRSVLIYRLVFLLVLLTGPKAYAQKPKMVTGESQIRVEVSQSQAEAEEHAVEQAKIDALISAFGQFVEQEAAMNVESGKVGFRSYGQTKVKGEWIRTIGEPVLSYHHQGAETWITCKIKGEARKALPKADVQIEVLSCPQKNCRTDEFVNEQPMYLYVKSPVDGFLSVFLDDGTTVYRLLPYRRMGSQKAVPVEGDHDYILFSREIENFGVPADRLELFTNKDYESNTLIVVFAENEFSKPLLYDEQADEAAYIIPKSVSKKSFEEWLGDQRALIPDFLDIQKRILITKEWP